MQATIHISRLHGGLCDCLARHVWFTKQACLANVHDGLVDDGIWHENDGLPELKPVQRQPRAVPQVPEEHLQNTDDLVALQCTTRQERQRRGTITIGNPVHGAFQPNGYVNRSRDMVSPAVYTRLSSHHFDIQSTEITLSWFLLPFTRACLLTTLTFRARKSHCHGFSCRLPALDLNHFDTQSTEITLSWFLLPFTRACLLTTLTFRARKSHCHGFSCRLPALDLNHFDTQSTEITLSWLLSPFTRACSCLEFSPL